eukprot:TRINITY_DN1019_c0_g1_i2.p3 TRINITY_DN1019_c0_g1~~TRINITY_DN1019_c0_g1_i2.p3  ORF type:complete len:100 (+),score=14.24 TRINITY_DN1019_c0_g1_i2:235-534(+)
MEALNSSNALVERRAEVLSAGDGGLLFEARPPIGGNASPLELGKNANDGREGEETIIGCKGGGEVYAKGGRFGVVVELCERTVDGSIERRLYWMGTYPY